MARAGAAHGEGRTHRAWPVLGRIRNSALVPTGGRRALGCWVSRLTTFWSDRVSTRPCGPICKHRQAPQRGSGRPWPPWGDRTGQEGRPGDRALTEPPGARRAQAGPRSSNPGGRTGGEGRPICTPGSGWQSPCSCCLGADPEGQALGLPQCPVPPGLAIWPWPWPWAGRQAASPRGPRRKPQPALPWGTREPGVLWGFGVRLDLWF